MYISLPQILLTPSNCSSLPSFSWQQHLTNKGIVAWDFELVGVYSLRNAHMVPNTLDRVGVVKVALTDSTVSLCCRILVRVVIAHVVGKDHQTC